MLRLSLHPTCSHLDKNKIKNKQRNPTFQRENVAEGVCLTGDGVNTDVIGLRAFPLPAERYQHALRLTEYKGNAAVSLRDRSIHVK